MQKITEEIIKDYVSELGEFETERRKGSTFYATASLTFTDADIKYLKVNDNVDASGLLGIRVVLRGIYDDYNGTDWDEIDYYKVEETQELVPEKVIPAHYETKKKYVEFKPSWE